ncbi:alpha/beta fold hydrolase [Pseudomonas mangrovi]|uniref:Alpha/beta hydrolase n=1 Tax=Pseudomonas mangrovi TaxID=2161748 RepID=A0A2T5PBE6_9PSED|nr:alpha/beta hydrolase [Pseudomonas mangrovi]PTU75015.1 alpha/beta hydrolase [Pseudomonas mangrovi]
MSRLLRHLVVSLAPGRVLNRLQDDARRSAGLVRREQLLDDGSHYVYLEGGSGEALMLLHGFGANKDNFCRVAAHLTRHYRVIIPDHIGFGESAKPHAADYGCEAQAERLEQLLVALGVESLHLGGNSMGGQIALVFAARHPQRVRSLWLLNSAGLWSAPSGEAWELAGREGGNPLLVRSAADYHALLARSMRQPPALPRALVRVLAAPRIANAALEQQIFDVLTSDSVEDRVRGLATPALIVWGEEDRIIPVAAAEVLGRLLPNSQLIRLPGVGHLPMLECPERVADDYLQFRAALLPVAQGAA